MNIGLVTPALRGANAVDGGVASYFADLAIGLRNLGHTVRVMIAADHRPSERDRDPALSGVRILTAPAAMPRWLHRLTAWDWRLNTVAGLHYRMTAAATALHAAHAAEPFDVIETTSSGLLVGRYLADHQRPPVATRVSTLARQLVTYNGGQMRWLERLEDRWERRLVWQSDVIISHTRLHREEICAEWELPSSRVRVIPLGIALPPDTEVQKSTAATAGLTILFVGRCEHRKGIDVLLAALPAVFAENGGASAEIVGEDAGGYWEARWRASAPAAVVHRVQFRGKLSAPDLIAAYRRCSVFVAPSRYESFGLIFVEAMGWAKPVVACNAGGIPEVVADGETGLLVPPNDAPALAKAVLTLLGDPAMRVRFGQAGRGRAEVRFSQAALAAASASLYRELINQNRLVHRA